MDKKFIRTAMQLMILVLMLVCFLRIADMKNQQHIFSTEKWVSDYRSRRKMVGNLLATYDFYNKDISYVEGLLGHPNHIIRKSDIEFRYAYGYLDSMGMNDYYLIFEFEDGIVKGYSSMNTYYAYNDNQTWTDSEPLTRE